MLTRKIVCAAGLLLLPVLAAARAPAPAVLAQGQNANQDDLKLLSGNWTRPAGMPWRDPFFRERMIDPPNARAGRDRVADHLAFMTNQKQLPMLLVGKLVTGNRPESFDLKLFHFTLQSRGNKKFIVLRTQPALEVEYTVTESELVLKCDRPLILRDRHRRVEHSFHLAGKWRRAR